MIGIPSQQYRKKPTMQQTELADLHFVDAKRIKELGNAAELPAYRTMVRCLDETSVEKNREQLEALLRAFGKERQHFIDLIKAFPFTITGMGEFKEAIITRGGVSVKEINPGTMESKKISGLYFAGEVLDLDAVTGGYNLQIAWSTAYLAAQAIQ